MLDDEQHEEKLDELQKTWRAVNSMHDLAICTSFFCRLALMSIQRVGVSQMWVVCAE